MFSRLESIFNNVLVTAEIKSKVRLSKTVKLVEGLDPDSDLGIRCACILRDSGIGYKVKSRR